MLRKESKRDEEKTSSIYTGKSISLAKRVVVLSAKLKDEFEHDAMALSSWHREDAAKARGIQDGSERKGRCHGLAHGACRRRANREWPEAARMTKTARFMQHKQKASWASVGKVIRWNRYQDRSER